MGSKYYTPFSKTPLKWIPLSKSGASKSRPLWAAHTSIGNVWEYPPPGIFSLPVAFWEITFRLSKFRLHSSFKMAAVYNGLFANNEEMEGYFMDETSKGFGLFQLRWP